MTERVISLFLPFPPTTNNLFAGTVRRYPSQGYTNWKKRAHQSFAEANILFSTYTIPVRADYHFGRPDNRRRDLSNYFKAVDDFLVEVKVLEDDSLIHAITADWSLLTPGVVSITITPL